jgi:uncharacterized protein YkwD
VRGAHHTIRPVVLAVLLTVPGCEFVGEVEGGIVSDTPAVQETGDHDVTLDPFITDGQPDFGHPTVGELSSGGAGCTATLVGKRTVLTAGHCVPSQSAVFVLNGQSFPSAKVFRHPNYGGGNYSDIAVVILQQAPPVAPSPIANFAPHVGQPITLVGYGKTGENASDYGTKRVGTNTISDLSGTTLSFQGATNICNGDSGGPTFVNVGTPPQEVVVGVHSTKSGFCGAGGNDMRVDAYYKWISQVAAGDVVSPGAGAPSPGPGEPDPGGAPPPPGEAIALEGEGCWKRPCLQGLVCVEIYDGTALIAKHCMERCASLGQDANCDGGEQCTQSKSQGRVCFNPQNPKGGYTSGGPGSGGQSPNNPTPPPGGNNNGACGGPEESQVFTLLNQVRAQYGRGALKCDLAGSQVARAHSQDMCNKGYFSHTSPDGKAPWDRLKAAGVPFSSAGENIAMGYQSPQAVHDGWMGSPGHQQNMLSASWTRVGIGLVRCGGTPYWTEVFMR